jgi:hypothetical protein
MLWFFLYLWKSKVNNDFKKNIHKFPGVYKSYKYVGYIKSFDFVFYSSELIYIIGIKEMLLLQVI